MTDIEVNEALSSTTSEMDGKYLTFLTQGQLFGIAIADVVQIVGMQEITEIPDFPSYAKGIINLRGTITPLIDMRLRLGKSEKAYDERTCIIVTLMNGNIAVGFIVDEVDAVTSIDEANISPPPKVAHESGNPYLIGVARHEGRVVLLMDVSRILSQDVVEVLVSPTADATL